MVSRSKFSVFKFAFYTFFCFWYIFILLTISNMTSLIMEDCGGERPSVQIVNNEKSRNCFTSFSSLFISSFSSLFILFKLFYFFLSLQINAGFGFAQKFMMRTLPEEKLECLSEKKRNKMYFPVLCTELRYFAHAIALRWRWYILCKYLSTILWSVNILYPYTFYVLLIINSHVHMMAPIKKG